MQILNSYSYASTADFILPLVFIFVTTVAMTIYLIRLLRSKTFNISFYVWPIVILILIAICFCLKVIPTIRNNPQRYEVILDENYSAVELFDNYKIIDKQGNIWILEDKN